MMLLAGRVVLTNGLNRIRSILSALMRFCHYCTSICLYDGRSTRGLNETACILLQKQDEKYDTAGSFSRFSSVSKIQKN